MNRGGNKIETFSFWKTINRKILNLAKFSSFAERFYIKKRNDFVRQLNLEISTNICSVKSISTNTQELLLATKLLTLST